MKHQQDHEPQYEQGMHKALYFLISRDMWTEELLDELYFYPVVNYLLSDRELEIVSLKIQGYEDEEIKRLIGYKSKPHTYRCVITGIKRKYKDRYFIPRVDNKRYGWMGLDPTYKGNKPKENSNEKIKETPIVGGDYWDGSNWVSSDPNYRSNSRRLGDEEGFVCDSGEGGDSEEA